MAVQEAAGDMAEPSSSQRPLWAPDSAAGSRSSLSWFGIPGHPSQIHPGPTAGVTGTSTVTALPSIEGTEMGCGREKGKGKKHLEIQEAAKSA